jgi:putative ABC transport system substrate-binding protein
VKRRAFLQILTGGLLAAPLAMEAQPAGKVWRITYARDLEAFRQRLGEFGYVERKNLVIESRVADSSFERLRALATQLLVSGWMSSRLIPSR